MNKPTILVVEDDPSISKLISITLEMHDYLYRTAKTGNEAILEILSNKADIIILDLGLPDIDGIE
ncbi:MAG: response regulator, partial [Carnobacterium sp.]